MRHVKKTVAATGGLALAACAACCAPLVVTPIMALIAAGGAGFALFGQVAVGALMLAGLAGYVLHRRWKARRDAAKGCACPEDATCKAGDAATADAR